MTAQAGEGFGSWADALESLWPQGSDPLGVWRLFEECAAGLADEPAGDAAARLEAALAEARRRREEGAGALEAMVRQWADGIAALQSATPFADPGLSALGPFAERREHLAALPRRAQDYQQALARHLDGAGALAAECIAAFRRALDDAPRDADALTLAQLWCRLAEPRYERWLAEESTRKDISDLINCWSALAGSLRTLTDDALESLGLPSSRGLDELAAELQRQRRRQRRETAELRREIAELRRAIGEGSGSR